MSQSTSLPNHRNKPDNGDLLPGELADLRQEAATLIEDADNWLDSPNRHFGGRRPNELIGTNQEQLVRLLLRSLKYGIPL